MAVDLPDFLKSGEIARLIPVAAVGQREQHAASVLLATLSIVQPYARDLLATIGKRVGAMTRIQAFTEVVFRKQPNGLALRPDGLLVIDTSRSQWRALIECKIGAAQIEPEQLEGYVQLATENKIDTIITISNELTALPDQPPYPSPAAGGKVSIFHWSWMKLVTLAGLLLAGQEELDAEQHYILKETLRYFQHENVGVRGLNQMNAHWRPLVSKIHAGGAVHRNDIEVADTVKCWHQEQHDICLMLARHLKVPVNVRLKKAHRDSQTTRIADDAELLAGTKTLSATFEIPNLAGPLEVVADLLRRNVACRMLIQAPEDRRRASSRINWLLRQLPEDLDGETAVSIFWKGGGTSFARLAALRADPEGPCGEYPSAVPKAFEIASVTDLDRRFFGPRTFIEGLEAAVPQFYDQIAKHIRAWQPLPPAGPAAGSEDLSPASDAGVSIIRKSSDRVVERGEYKGRTFAIFEDGSIEIETAAGRKWFKDVLALRHFADARA